jgi:DNA segregation ATPase FtsK/SpoIIIE, S-DNA-T family
MPKRRKPIARQVPRALPRQTSFFDDISPHTKQAIGAILFVVLAIFFIFSSLGYAGIAGELTHDALYYLFGWGFALAPFICALFVYVFLKPRDDEHVSLSKLTGVVIFFVSSLALLELWFTKGGGLGMVALYPFAEFFGGIVAGVILVAFFFIGVFLTFNTNIIHLFKRNQEEELEEMDPLLSMSVPEPGTDTSPDVPEADDTSNEDAPKKKTLTERIMSKAGPTEFVVSSFIGTYAPPPLSLLHKDKGTPDVGDVKANSITIKRTLKKFNIDVEMDAVTIGSSVTRYAIKPAEGVKLEKIVSLQTNLEYALAASPIRIEAPIPGKSLVGIEVPNKVRQTVGLASLFSSAEYTDSPKPLLVALGKNITGEAQFADVARMPHGLIAGTTGSGKSVAIHNVVVSLLFRNSPEQLRFIMVDPKRIELTLYNGIPHLLTPVITDAKKSIIALKWSIKEMERRLDILGHAKVQNIGTYHDTVYRPAKQKFEKNGSPEDERNALPEPLPYIVIIIDELADLMSTYPKELEASIVRLAQMSRAVGIHLMLSTQRPSVNVITGLIKANVPTRIAFNVASQIDSRTILDQSGAEKLLGKGDMLFLSNESPKPIRLQSAFVTNDEVMKVVNYLKDQTSAQELSTINLDPNSDKADPNAIFASNLEDGDDDDDDMYEDARQAVLEAGKASTSYLQRRLRLGYSRAARLMDLLEARGVIGPADGSKPRPVIDGGSSQADEEI